MDYSKTVNLPKTDFPMRANLTSREQEILKNWENSKIYNKIIEKNKNSGKQFILHDGPPYANGKIHIGHALNKILKDIVVKQKSMLGFYSPFVPGWDCHGMPIEHKVIENLGSKHKQMEKIDIRKECKKYALEHISIQREDFKRLGCLGEWENPYLTLNPVYEAAIIEMFGDLADKGYIYKGMKPVHWCYNCETALADAEVEYDNHQSPSIFVKFKIKDNLNIDLPDNTFFVIWTTTPWTLPANVGIAVHPDFTYNLFKINNEYFIAVEELTKSVAGKILNSSSPEEKFEIIKKFKGIQLKNILCSHPFLDRTSKVITGNFVTLDTGSGCVHIAPGHGEDDYIAGKEHGLPTISPVDNSGRFTSEFELMKGENVFKANPKVIDLLKSKSALIGEPENIEHSYPHCWRCKKPIIFRATYQWFLNIEHLNLRQNLLNAIQNDVNWVPNWGQDRIKAMVTLRPDWCLSRQRIWGVPIPVMYCSDCNTPLIDKTNIEFFKKLVEKHGVDCWFTMKPNDLLPEGAKCSKCGGKNFTKETDILDVWFDSGASHIAVLEKRDYLSSPADLYLEGSDQHRGWFQLSLIPSIATRNRAPFKTVLTHGFVVDGNGKKMSKSEGNVIAPQEIISKYGADILRLWTAYEDYRNDVSIGKNIVDRLVEAYKKIRNTLRFLLSNLNDFNFQKDKIEYSKLADIDKWMLAELFELSNKINLAYEEFRFHSIYHLIYGFCIKELSSFYLDVLKERLYLSGPDSLQRRSAQTVLFEILRALTHFIAPILSYTAEETAKFYPDITDNKDSIFLSQWPVLDKQFDNSEVINNWKEIINFREDATKAQEIARNSKSINQSLESKIIVYIKSEKNFNLFSKLKDEIRAALICSELEINLFDEDSKIDYDYDGQFAAVKIEKLEHKKCLRCWKIKPDLDSNPNFPGICGSCGEIVSKYYGSLI